MRIVSLFANIGVAEACLYELESAHVVVANELLPRRAALITRRGCTMTCFSTPHLQKTFSIVRLRNG